MPLLARRADEKADIRYFQRIPALFIFISSHTWYALFYYLERASTFTTAPPLKRDFSAA